MAGHWELLEISTSGAVNYYSAKYGRIVMDYKEFLRQRGVQVTMSSTTRETITFFLADGWEPFSADDKWLFFRRLVG